MPPRLDQTPWSDLGKDWVDLLVGLSVQDRSQLVVMVVLVQLPSRVSQQCVVVRKKHWREGG